MLCLLVLNGIDVTRYAYSKMQVHNAAQMGAQSAWKSCDPVKELPATVKCARLRNAIAAAVRSTSLGEDIRLQPNSPSEGYYCINTSNALVRVGAISGAARDCSSYGMANLRPGLAGDYVRIDVTFAYQPMFPGLSVGGLLKTPITETTYMRLM